MLTIRLFRIGKKNQPSFKIVVTDKKNKPRAGRFTEEVGFYNPLTKEKVLKGERIKHWISVGAKPSPTIFNLLISEGIIEGKKIPKHKKSKKTSEAKTAESEAKPAEVTAPQEKPKEEVKKEEAVPEKPAEEKAEEPKAEEKPKEEVKEEKKPEIKEEAKEPSVDEEKNN